MIASYYYIQYTTIELFSSSLQSGTKLKGLVEILASAAEFDALPVRHREDVALQQLAAHCPLAISEPRFNDPHVKANVLLQAHFSRREVGRELALDTATVLDKATRLLQARQPACHSLFPLTFVASRVPFLLLFPLSCSCCRRASHPFPSSVRFLTVAFARPLGAPASSLLLFPLPFLLARPRHAGCCRRATRPPTRPPPPSRPGVFPIRCLD
jgi:hypothetical protein